MEEGPKQIAFVVYPGVTVLDLFGPLQVMTAMGLFTDDYACTVVAKSLEPVATDSPAGVVPDRTFAQVPHPFAVIVPGGAAPTMKALGDEELISYVRSAARDAEVVGSVCTGALILAAAGLLEGRDATTHWGFAKQLERLGARYLPERFVHDGDLITSAGISAGIDMALWLVGRLAGDEVAGKVQLLIEYDPQPPLGRIDWNGVDRDLLDPLVNGWIREGLTNKPALASLLTGGS